MPKTLIPSQGQQKSKKKNQQTNQKIIKLHTCDARPQAPQKLVEKQNAQKYKE
jgi:ribosomal protein L35AE/L33A